MHDSVTRRPIPVGQSILWKPLHDPHYVVASLQLGDGGRRTVFVRQQALARVEALVRAHGRRTVGLLLGRFYQCPTTGADYLVVESIVEQKPVSDEAEVAAAVTEAVADQVAAQRAVEGTTERRVEVLGWFRGVSTVEARPSSSTAGIHTSLFNQPWQMSLVVGASSLGFGGAFFLRDHMNSRWFCAPFYEMLDHAPTPHQPKPTLLNWPQYLTADNVTRRERATMPASELADVRAETPREPPDLTPSPAKENGSHPVPSMDIADAPAAASPTQPSAAPPPSSTRHSFETEVEPPAPVNRRTARPLHRNLADIPKTDRERPIATWADRGEKLSIIDDRDQRTVAPSSGRAVDDADDTTPGDDPGRYIELARSEGFFIAAKFNTMSELGRAETLWILNEPFSGLLLVVVTTDTEVVDASLHYNLQTDDAGLRKTPFPEHRDDESKTIYVRETCVDLLRDRCRRLRATNAVLREWKVTPTIWLLTPAEWESVPASDVGVDRGASAIADLNAARIRELPPGVRSQFHVGAAEDADA